MKSGIIVMLKQMLSKKIINENRLKYLSETLKQIGLLFIIEAFGISVNTSSSITIYSYK